MPRLFAGNYVALADPARVTTLQSFFKTGAGGYGEGDRFIGVGAPHLRALCRECRGAALDAVMPLLRSPIHEERSLALRISDVGIG